MHLDDLKGKRPAYRVKKDLDLGGVVEQGDFGALWGIPKTHDGEDYQLQGSLGIQGKRFPALAKLVADPGKSEGGHERPALRIFVEADGSMLEYGVGFRRDKDGKTFFTGETTGKVGKRAGLFFWPIDQQEEVPDSF